MAERSSPPFPVSVVKGRYLLFDVEVVTFLRREYAICGVLVGTLSQAPQQNVFLGIPLELMLEEIHLLASKGIIYVVDEAGAQQRRIANLTRDDVAECKQFAYQQGVLVTQALQDMQQKRREDALQAQARKRASALPALNVTASDETSSQATEMGTEDSLFSSTATPATSIDASPTPHRPQTLPLPYGITPATPISASNEIPQYLSTVQGLPSAPSSYPLFVHLHSKGYFLSPGLRFGCQYMAYPGDPLRYHSHFLVVSKGWNERFDLINLIAGGRLGTGVKKSFLLGGPEEREDEGSIEQEEKVRTFCIEWAGM